MTIEAALQENTAALRDHAAALRAVAESNFGKPGVHGGDKPAAAPAKPTKAPAAATGEAAAPDYEKVVNPKILECVKKAGRETAVSILAQYKDADGNPCKNGKGLQAADYAKVVSDCDSAIIGAGAIKTAEEAPLV